MRQLRPVEKQWIFTHSALENTPSVDDGINLETELKRRKLTIEYMRSLALRANALVNGDDPEGSHLRGSMIVGSTLLHRFYMRRSFKDFSEKLIAPTILFLATKIEEEPLKLRHIVNSCISKFDLPGAQGWYPDRNPHEQPSREYKAWEKQILATEEVVLEALCFDMGVDQPYTILLKSIKGLDEVLAKIAIDQQPNGNGNGDGGMVDSSHINGNGSSNGSRKENLTGSFVTELGWVLLSESTLSPLSILYPAQIISFVTLIIIISIADQIPLSIGMINASELSDRFGIDLTYREGSGNENDERGLRGEDVEIIKSCLTDFIKYMNGGLIDSNSEIGRYIVAEPAVQSTTPYRKRFSLNTITDSNHQNGDSTKSVNGDGNANGNETENQTDNRISTGQGDDSKIESTTNVNKIQSSVVDDGDNDQNKDIIMDSDLGLGEVSAPTPP